MYLQSLRTARDCCEDVVAVHGAQDQLGAVPHFGAVLVAALEAAGPSLQAGHADGRQVAEPPLGLDLDAGRGVLPGGDEECPVNQRVSKTHICTDCHVSQAWRKGRSFWSC